MSMSTGTKECQDLEQFILILVSRPVIVDQNLRDLWLSTDAVIGRNISFADKESIFYLFVSLFFCDINHDWINRRPNLSS